MVSERLERSIKIINYTNMENLKEKLLSVLEHNI